jgi:hypothetical protein
MAAHPVVYDLETRLSFRTDARRDNAVTQITNYVQQFVGDMYVEPQIGPYDGAYKGWPHALSAYLRFKTQSTRDDLWGQMDTALGTGNNGPVPGATAWRRTCDETQEMLVVATETRTW